MLYWYYHIQSIAYKLFCIVKRFNVAEQTIDKDHRSLDKDHNTWFLRLQIFLEMGITFYCLSLGFPKAIPEIKILVQVMHFGNYPKKHK